MNLRLCYSGQNNTPQATDNEEIERFLSKYKIDYAMLEPIISEAMEKVNQFDEAIE